MRWSLRKSASPFDCDKCFESDKAARNCSNFKGLSGRARAVEAYDAGVAVEIASKECSKVVSLGDLRLYECPLSYITEETFEMMRTVFLIESAGRPYMNGGLESQPCWAVEAFEIYQFERARTTCEKNG